MISSKNGHPNAFADATGVMENETMSSVVVKILREMSCD